MFWQKQISIKKEDTMSNSEKSIANLKLSMPEGMEASVSLKPMQQRPRYYMIGNGIRNNFMGKDHSPIDFIDVMANMSTQELWVVKLLKDNLILIKQITDNGIKLRTSSKSIIKQSNLSQAEKQKFKIGYKRLHEKNVLKRIKREHYILNPNFFIPYFYNDELLEWNSLT